MAKQENLRTDKCEWTIMAPMGSKVNMTFASMKMLRGRIRNIMGLTNALQMATISKICNNSELIVSTSTFV